MSHYRFLVVAACVIMPPLLYIGIVQVAENHLQNRIQSEIESIYIGDTVLLLEGASDLTVTVPRNIDDYQRRNGWKRWGVNVSVTVTTQNRKLIYPPAFKDAPGADSVPKISIQVATENFRLLNEGLDLVVGATVAHNTLPTNSLLVLLIFSSVTVLYVLFQMEARQQSFEQQQRSSELTKLRHLVMESTFQMSRLEDEKSAFQDSLRKLKGDLEQQQAIADRNEEDLFEEIELLEEKINSNIQLQTGQKDEIAKLEDKISLLEKKKARSAGRRRGHGGNAQKRFATLYKHLVFQERAIDGFADLAEDMKLKCEEVISQLNDQPDLVAVKRKVFGKRNRETVFETIFGYRGRLYYRKTSSGGLDIVVVGTKNSQKKDMEYIGSL